MLKIHKKQHSTPDAGLSLASPSPSSLFPVLEFQHLTRLFPLIAPFMLPAAVIPASALTRVQHFSFFPPVTFYLLLLQKNLPINIKRLLDGYFLLNFCVFLCFFAATL
jgi:hypothetical protein